MLEYTDELMELVDRMIDELGCSVPMRDLPEDITTDEVMDGIRKSLEAGRNMFPELYEIALPEGAIR